MVRVDIQEVKTHLSSYIERVEKGDVVVVCRHTEPVAELRAIQPEPAREPRIAGLLKGQVHWQPDAFAPMTTEELAEFDGAALFPSKYPA